jgi:transcriptional regulator with XRE-family HTH domain
MVSVQPSPGAPGLARRLRELREREHRRLTQAELGQALGDENSPLRPTTISNWENPSSGRLPREPQLEGYARLFCTPRSFAEGGVRMLATSELTAEERTRFEALKQELLGLREAAVANGVHPSVEAQSMWHFPDGAPITLACAGLPAERQPKSADPVDPNYVKAFSLADLDTLIDIYGAVKAYNPQSDVRFKATEDLEPKEIQSHLVLIGGLAWQRVNSWLKPMFPMLIEDEDPGERKAVVIRHPEGQEMEFKSTWVGNTLVEDVGFFARGKNPTAPDRTLTICGGITTRGVHGAALCFIDRELRERNEGYLFPRFPEGSIYCIGFRVPVANNDPLPPDLSKAENRLFEWSDPDWSDSAVDAE